MTNYSSVAGVFYDAHLHSCAFCYMEEIRAGWSCAVEWCAINPILDFNVTVTCWAKKTVFGYFIFHLWFQNVVTSFYKCDMCRFMPLSFELSCCSCVINILLTLISTVRRLRELAWTRAQLSPPFRPWGGDCAISKTMNYLFINQTLFDNLALHLYY